MRLSRLAGVLFLAGLRLWAQPCEPSSEIKSAIEGATGDRVAAAKKLRDQFPLDYFAHKHYQDLFLTQTLYSKEVQQEYRALSDAHPDDLLYTLLHARVLKGTNTPELIKLMDRVLTREAENPQAHLKLVEVYSAPAFRDDAKLQAHAEAYWKACPSSLGAYAHIRQVENRQFAQRAATRLRPLLENRNDEEALGLYGVLWSLEFKAVPLSAQDPVRERIRKDVERLRAVEVKRPQLLGQLKQAYESLGDQEGVKWVSEQMQKTGIPGHSQSTEISLAISQWRRANMPRTMQREIYNEKLLKQTEEWTRQWPDDPQPRYERFQALQMSEAAPLEEIISAADEWLRIYEKRPSFISPYLQVANFYDRFHVRYEQIPALLDKALRQEPAQAAASAPVSDLITARDQTARAQATFSTWNSAANLYLKLKKYDRAKELLDKISASPILKERSSESARDIFVWSYWNNMARLARVEGRKLDAITYQRNAMFANISSSPEMQKSQRASLLEDWKELKGSEEGFEAFMTKPGSSSEPAKTARSAIAAPQPGWAKLDKPLPDFELEDAAGKTWRIADLKGKITFVNLWATWCGPCREELPHLQKLFDKLRDRKDLAVVTLNTDDNLGLILPFMKQHHYTFPVLPASDYVRKLIPQLSIPRNWIVTGDGVLRLEKIGFGGASDKWAEEMVAEMERARQGTK